MTGVLSTLTALLLSTAILLIGHGLQQTLVPLYADQLGWSHTIIGYMGSAYYAGFVVGCVTIPKLVSRVGHIRVFGTLACGATAALLLIGIQDAPILWMVARMVTGWCFAGIYMVIESWLNERTTADYRGGVLSVYTVISLLAICIGQTFIGLDLDFTRLAMLGAILISLGMVPVALTRSPAPDPIPAVSFKFKQVLGASQVAVVGALLGGIVTGGFWALGPLVAKAQGLSTREIGLFMGVTILGGVILQWPVGRLSDRLDRRFMILATSLLCVLVCVLAPVAANLHPLALYVPMMLFGGLTFPLYSLCLAHANDNTSLQLIDVASVILLMNGAGSVVGPILVATLMGYTPFALFIVAGVTLMLLALWTAWRMRLHESSHRFFVPFVMVPRTTHEVTEMADIPPAEEVQAGEELP